MEKNAVHLELAALLHRLWPPAARLSPAIAAGLTVLLIARLARRGWRSPIDGATEAACLAVALLSFYHRAYDLAGLLALVAWIVARSPWRAAAAMWLGMVIACLPGPVINDSVATGSWAIDALVQPTPAWGLVVLTVGLLTLVGQRPGPSAGRAMPIMPQ